MRDTAVAADPEALLEGRGLTRVFGGLIAVNDVSVTLRTGEILGLIGPNGAGKTTLFQLLSGFEVPDHGMVFLRGRNVTGRPPHQICRAGLARTFQVVQPFMELTVLENVMIGSFNRERHTKRATERAWAVLRRVGLDGQALLLARQLTIPDRKRLELARALATEPAAILLDEVMAGLTPTEIEEVIAMLREIRRGGISILLTEHLMQAVLALCDRVVVLHHGALIAEGAPLDVAEDPRVVDAYLGGTAHIA